MATDEYGIQMLGKLQYEVLGYTDLEDKDLDWRYVLVSDLNTSYSPKFGAYSFGKGKSIEMKIHKKKPRNDKEVMMSFNELPIEDGDVIYIKKVRKQPRKKKVGDVWEVIPDTFDWWIKDYSKVM